MGIKKATKFSELLTFHGHSFFPVDELHLWGSNISKKIWQIISGDFNNVQTNMLLLPASRRKAIGEAIAQSGPTIPSGVFEGDFRS